ncbi:MAG: SCO family protein [Phycisphaerales bacterium]
MKRNRVQFGAAFAAVFTAGAALAQLNPKEPPEPIRNLEVKERLGERIPLDLSFRDSTGATVKLSKYFNAGKPVILVLGYYDCPMVCPLILERLRESLNQVDFTVGEDFRVVYVSFDPDNTPAMAAASRHEAVESYQRPRTEAIDAGWAFHVSDAGPVKRLADALGYEYRYLDESGEYSHPVALAFLSGDGVISRYIYGFDYDPRDVKLSLLEASKGAISKSLGDRLMWFCFHYDPSTGKYSLAAFRVMRAGGLVTLVGVGGLILSLKLGERARRRSRASRESRLEVIGGTRLHGRAAIAGHQA